MKKDKNTELSGDDEKKLLESMVCACSTTEDGEMLLNIWQPRQGSCVSVVLPSHRAALVASAITRYIQQLS